MMQENLAMCFKLSQSGETKKSIDKVLSRLLEDRFAILNGCIFLNSLMQLNKNATLQDSSDKTGFECYVNSVHMTITLRLMRLNNQFHSLLSFSRYGIRNSKTRFCAQ